LRGRSLPLARSRTAYRLRRRGRRARRIRGVLRPGRRGRCSFGGEGQERAEARASGIIIRNTLESRYDVKREGGDGGDVVDAVVVVEGDGSTPDWTNTIWPMDMYDYECGTNGHARDGYGIRSEACCAWDVLMVMGSDGGRRQNAGGGGRRHPLPFRYDGEGDGIVRPGDGRVYEQRRLSRGARGTSRSCHTPGGVRPRHYSTLLLWSLAIFALWSSARRSAREYGESWSKISDAVSDGVLVLRVRDDPADHHTPPSSRGRRARADTDDTVDSEDEGGGIAELRFAEQSSGQVETTTGTTTTTTTGTTRVVVAGVDGHGEGAAAASGTAESPRDGDFAISDATSDEDNFVGSPTKRGERAYADDSPPPPIDDGGSSFAPVGSFRPEEGEEAPSPPPPAARQQERPAVPAADRSLEFKGSHTVLLIVAASSLLFLLFFFDLHKFVLVLYGLLGSWAVTLVVVLPTYEKISSKFLGDVAFDKLHSPVPRWLRLGGWKWIDVASLVTAYLLGVAWLIVGFTLVQPMNSAYYWIFQDVMGVCACVLLLGLVHIRTIMIATIVLTLLFVYDVFFVLISPYIFGTSVMVDVATGNPSDVDPSFCEKYPTNPGCRGSLAPLPMMLAIPWFNDYRGGFSMVGLGDIVLPGLLVSFAARFDAARELVTKCSQISNVRIGEGVSGETNDSGDGASSRCRYHFGRICKALFSGYFGPLVVAYAVGLLVTYISVWMTKKGQPALLYIVPACLGTIFFLGWRRRELSELWLGPKVMKKADRMVGIAGKIPAARAAAAREASNNLAETSSVI
ncbi:hypothetical protein ACHAW5_003961, partial [Stephanodiscus triporus]